MTVILTFGSVLSTPERETPGPEEGDEILIVPEFGSSGTEFDVTLRPSVKDGDSSKLLIVSSSRHGIVVVVVVVDEVGSPGHPPAGAGTMSLMWSSCSPKSLRLMTSRVNFPPPSAWQMATFPRGRVVVVEGSDSRSTLDGHPPSGAGMMSPS